MKLENVTKSYPIGTTVDLYSDAVYDAGHPAPAGVLVSSGVVDAAGDLDFGPVDEDGTTYIAAARIAGDWLLFRITTTPLAEVGGAGGGTELPFIDAMEFVGKAASLTDKGPQLQTAIDRAHEYEMALLLPAWRVVTAQTLRYYDRSYLLGHGSMVSGVKLGDGSNVDLLESSQFGVSSRANFTLEAFGLDGNEANNESGNGLMVDGLTFTLRDLLVYRCSETGIIGTKTSAAEGSATAYMDAWIEDVKSYLNVDGGWSWGGPHDAHFSNCHAISNHSYGFRFWDEGFAAKVYACHAYGTHKYGFQLEASIKAVNCESEGASKAEVALWEDNCTWLGGSVFQDLTSAEEGKVGFQFGRSAGEGEERSAFNTKILLPTVKNCTNGAFKLVNGWSGSRIQAYVDAEEGTAFTGTAPTRGQLDVLLHLQHGVTLGIDTATQKLYSESDVSEVMGIWRPGDSNPRMVLMPNKLLWGPGDEALDLTLERDEEGHLVLTGGPIEAVGFIANPKPKIEGNKGPTGGALSDLLGQLNNLELIDNKAVSPILKAKAAAKVFSLGTNCPDEVEITPGAGPIEHISGTNSGHKVTLYFATEVLVKKAVVPSAEGEGENLKLSADFAATPDDTLTIFWDGSFWRETSRSVN